MKNKKDIDGTLIEVREALDDIQSEDDLYGMDAHEVARQALEKLDAFIDKDECETVEVVDIETLMSPEMVDTGQGIEFEYDDLAIECNKSLRRLVEQGYQIIRKV